MDEAPTVHVWVVKLDVTDSVGNGLKSLLSEDELARAASYRFEIHRRRFISARGALRCLVGDCIGSEPEHLQFGYEPNGKPYLANAEDKVSFNVAHSEDVALIAIAKEGDIGVDVERVRWLPDFDELVARFFSTREARQFQALPLERKAAAFFNLWTRKEAMLKATGEGISDSLSRVEVTFLPGEPARLLAPPENSVTSDWTLRDLSCVHGYGAAIAIKANEQFENLSADSAVPAGPGRTLDAIPTLKRWAITIHPFGMKTRRRHPREGASFSIRRSQGSITCVENSL